MKKVLPYMIAAVMIAAALILDAAAIFLACTLPAKSNADLKPPAYLSEWQSYLTDDALLTEIVMPGAHDAGTVGMSNLMETQSHRLSEQLRFGARYFDVRPMLYQGELYPYHLLPNVFYPFRELLNEVVSFLTDHPSEFVVLDFQHFDGAEEKTKELLDSIPEISRCAVPTDCALLGLTMKDLRENGWNLFIVWNESYSPADRAYLHERGKTLYSPYNSDAHADSDETLLTEFARYYEEKPDGKFFVLQSQRTGKFGKEMNIYKLEQSFRPKANAFLIDTEGDTLQKTNIVMRDFITKDVETVETILSLNQRKELFT